MKFRRRVRGRFQLKWQVCVVKSASTVSLCVRVCRDNIYPMVLLLLMVLFLWWNIGMEDACSSHELVQQVCEEFKSRDTTGDLCNRLCVSKDLQAGICFDKQKGLKSFKWRDLVTRVSAQYEQSWPRDALPEGLQMNKFAKELKQLVEHELGITAVDNLLFRLFRYFDVNEDDQLNYGEAQNLWRLVKQPYFLVFYLFQDLQVFPSLNGTCGGLSMWHYAPVLGPGSSSLFNPEVPGWSLGLLSNNSYRWALPTWLNRAKVIMGLLEVVMDFYDRDGGRFHLCHLDGPTLRHSSSFELVLTETSLPLPAVAIHRSLSNITCHSHRDCQLTRQCETVCDVTSKTCSHTLTRPTLAHACDLMQDYLLFDTPHKLKATLSRLLRRCQALTWLSQDLDLQHSLLVLDLKDLLWRDLQHVTR